MKNICSAILVSTHGSTAEEIIKTAEMIIGKQENISFVNFFPGESTDDLMNKFQKELSLLDCSKGALVMVDLFGGSPFNVISKLAFINKNIEVITGVNIPMMLETLILRTSQDLEQLVIKAETTGINGITILDKNILENNDEMEDEL